MMVALKKALTETLRPLKEQPSTRCSRRARTRSWPMASSRRSPPAEPGPVGRGRPLACVAPSHRHSSSRSPEAGAVGGAAGLDRAARRGVASARSPRHGRDHVAPRPVGRTPIAGARLCVDTCATSASRSGDRRVEVTAAAAASIEASARARATRRWPMPRDDSARPPCCSPTTPTTRPRRCCCSSCAERARGLAAMPRCAWPTGSRGCGRSSRAAHDDRCLRHRTRARVRRRRQQCARRAPAQCAAASRRAAAAAIATGYPRTLVRAAALQAEAALLADDLAQIDAGGACERAASIARRRGPCATARATCCDGSCAMQRPAAPSAARAGLRCWHQLCAPAASRHCEIARRGLRGLELHQGRIVVHEPLLPQYAIELHGDAIELLHGRPTSRPAAAKASRRDTSRIARRSAQASPANGAPAGARGATVVADLLREAGVPHWERARPSRVHPRRRGCGRRDARRGRGIRRRARRTWDGPDWRPAVLARSRDRQPPGSAVL